MARRCESFVRSHRTALRGEVWPCRPPPLDFNCSARCILAHYDFPERHRSGYQALSWANEPACNLFHSQYGEDLLLLPTLMGAIGRRPGRFVELGAYNGLSMSNTLLLERCLGWRGLLIEAQPTNFAALNRSGRSAAMAHASTACGWGSSTGVARVTLAAGPTAGQVESMAKSFVRQYYGRGGGVGGTVEVPCRPLGSLMAASGADGGAGWDFLSLDVEGAEALVLQGVDASLFKVVMVEADGHDAAKDARVEAMLLGAGLRRAASLTPHGSRVYVGPGVQELPVRDRISQIKEKKRRPLLRTGRDGISKGRVGPGSGLSEARLAQLLATGA